MISRFFLRKRNIQNGLCCNLFLLVALFGAFFTKGTPEEEGQFPDGEATANEDLNATIKALKEYKSDWTIGRLLKDKVVSL